MTARTLCIKTAARFPSQDDGDVLALAEGVNLIVGEMNTGKTRWLQMIDFALGDSGSAGEAFSVALAEKYKRITLTVSIGSNEFKIERRWNEAGATKKIFVNGDGMTAKQFSEFILGELEIPLIKVPSGSPYSDRTWPELSWRELLRHMYKQELLWSDIVQKQADIVRSACILHFLDVAKNLYSDEYGQYVAKQKEKLKLEAEKDVFVRFMQDVAVDLVGQPEMSIAVTPDSVSFAKQRLSNRITEIEAERANVLQSVDRLEATNSPAYETAKQRLELLHQELGKLENERNQNLRRWTELTEYAKQLEAELGRFARVKTSAAAFADLKVTHCPACDQEILSNRFSRDCCQVCGQPEPVSDNSESAGYRRVEFEELQVTEELSELSKLLTELQQEAKTLDTSIKDIQQAIRSEQSTIAGARALSQRAIPPELSILEREAGQINAQLGQLDRIERSLATRANTNDKIAELEKEIAALDAQTKEMAPNVNYPALADLISDRMNDYLNSVNADQLSRWKTGRISVRLRRDSFDIFLDEERWNIKAGGTAYYIVQLAYHYALFSLTKDSKYNYPGFLVIDFPPHFAKAGDLKDSESYLLEPFVKLCAAKEMKNTQVIIGGRAFDNLKGANVIHL